MTDAPVARPAVTAPVARRTVTRAPVAMARRTGDSAAAPATPEHPAPGGATEPRLRPLLRRVVTPVPPEPLAGPVPEPAAALDQPVPAPAAAQVSGPEALRAEPDTSEPAPPLPAEQRPGMLRRTVDALLRRTPSPQATYPEPRDTVHVPAPVPDAPVPDAPGVVARELLGPAVERASSPEAVTAEPNTRPAVSTTPRLRRLGRRRVEARAGNPVPRDPSAPAARASDPGSAGEAVPVESGSSEMPFASRPVTPSEPPPEPTVTAPEAPRGDPPVAPLAAPVRVGAVAARAVLERTSAPAAGAAQGPATDHPAEPPGVRPLVRLSRSPRTAPPASTSAPGQRSPAPTGATLRRSEAGVSGGPGMPPPVAAASPPPVAAPPPPVAAPPPGPAPTAVPLLPPALGPVPDVRPTAPAAPAMLARQPSFGAGATSSLSTAASAGAGMAAAASGGGGGGGADMDHIYREMLRRLREEQEQLGQSVSEPF